MGNELNERILKLKDAASVWSLNAGLAVDKKRGACTGGFIVIVFILIFIISLHESGSFFTLNTRFIKPSHALNEVLANLLSGVNELSR